MINPAEWCGNNAALALPLGLSQINKMIRPQGGRGLAIAGLVLSRRPLAVIVPPFLFAGMSTLVGVLEELLGQRTEAAYDSPPFGCAVHSLTCRLARLICWCEIDASS